MALQLNSDQERAVDGCIDAFNESAERPGEGRNIIGEGGTGKTTCVMTFASLAIEEGSKVLFAAPTNKAVKQLEKSARAAGLVGSGNADFKTIFSALGLTVMPTSENKHVGRVRDPVVGKYDVVVVDEASMSTRSLNYDHLVPAMLGSERKTFLIQMGDTFQLPPPKEYKSTAFELHPSFELLKNERQQHNPDGSQNTILTLARALRGGIAEARPTKLYAQKDQNIQIIRDAHFLGYIAERFDLNTDLEQMRVMAWTNDRVDEINDRIRRKVYGKGAARFEIGERVVTGRPIKDPEEDDILLGTDEECIVTAVTESSVTDEETGDEWKTLCLCLTPVYAGGGQIFAHVLDESEVRRHERHLSELSAMAKDSEGSRRGLYWHRFWKFTELFSDIRYCFCITVHRSQGSTFTTAFVDIKNILGCPVMSERQRLAYVGISRPRSELILNRPEFIL